MPDSQSHRPAVSVSNSPSSRIQKLLERAVDLEKQLTKLSKSNDEKAARLRSHLCEVLSDILISEPSVGMENDCTGRLWRSCFYAPIGTWRSRISREKRKQGANLASLDQSFKKFLGEAITLYDYLILQYQSKVVPSSCQAISQESTQESRSAEAGLEGVVAGLHKLYIYMGDLYRYAESFTKAENCYVNASKLAPGMGNPYNQLAVVSQLKDRHMSCVGLYWYARSLLATHSSFDTSNSNLERLFTINREYMREHSREPTPPILFPANKKTSSDLVRAQRAAASKSGLAHFVDFHYELFKNTEANVEKESLLREKMASIVKSLQSLLQASAFGDGLLCKMMVINIFSFEMSKRSSVITNYRLSKDFLCIFGSCLAERLQNVLLKIVEKPGKLPPAIRLFTPFGILCEFVEQLEEDQRSEDENDFWRHFIEVANLVLQISKHLSISHVEDTAVENATLVLKEYHALNGFRPFKSLNEGYSLQTPFVTPREAVGMLDLVKSQPQATTPHGSVNENVMKVDRFLECCKRSAEAIHVPIQRTANGDYSFVVDVKPEATAPDEDMTDSDGIKIESLPCEDFPMESSIAENDEGGDVVIFKSPEGTDRPALLVPGTMFNGAPVTAGVSTRVVLREGQASRARAAKQSNVSQLLDRMAPAESNGALSAKTLVTITAGAIVPPPGIKPPPGFAAPVAQPISTCAVNVPLDGVYGQVIPGHLGLSIPIPQHLSFGRVASNPTQASHFQNFPPAGQPVQWFGGSQALQTANPFVGTHSMSFGAPNSLNSVYDEQESAAVDGASLLGTGLLDSLWMNESTARKTNNPFKNER